MADAGETADLRGTIVRCRLLDPAPGNHMSDEPSPSAKTDLVVGVEVPARLPGSLPLPATGREVAQYVALRAAACVGADYSNMALLDATGTALRLFHGTFLTPELADRYTDVPLSAPFPIAAAARSGRAVLLPDLASYGAQFPEILADTIAAGVQATASLPLHREDGTLVGAIGFAWTEPTTFDAKLGSALNAVADLCTATIERAERYDAEHQLIVELHRSLLGALPTMAGIEVSARYLPASETHSVGGDWYEGLLLDGERIALVVGDVTGHGVAAAADMALDTGHGHRAAPLRRRRRRCLQRGIRGGAPTSRAASRDRRSRRHRRRRRDGHVRDRRPSPSRAATSRR